MRSETPHKRIADVVKAQTPPECCAMGTSSTACYISKLLAQTIGTNFEIVLGYEPGQDIDPAMERGE
jgi:hypothetical protein